MLNPILQDCHTRAWDAVASYMQNHIQVLSGRTLEAEQTLMPASRSWLGDTVMEVGV